MRPTVLPPEELKSKLEQFPDWRVVDGNLARDLVFGSFTAAMEFMAAMAEVSEELDHHPTWTNTYRDVQIRISTHDAGGLTNLDFQWAAEADRLARTPEV